MTVSRAFWEAFRQALLAIVQAIEIELGMELTADLRHQVKDLKRQMADLKRQQAERPN